MTEKKTAFLVDSGCEPTRNFINKYNLEYVGMNIIMDGKSLVDGKQLLKEQFYAQADRVKDIATSPPSQSDMIQKYRGLRKRGYERIIDVHMSSKMSDLYRNSVMAKGFVTGIEIYVFDTRSVASGSHLIADKIFSMIDQGRPISEVESAIPEIIHSVQVLLSVSTLKYFIKNGRIGRAKGLVGKLLNLKPVLCIDDGMVTPFSTEKGMDRAIGRMVDANIEYLSTNPHNVKIYKGYGATNNIPYMDQAFEKLKAALPRLGIRDYEVESGRGWPTITCHTGPEVFTLSVYGERNPI